LGNYTQFRLQMSDDGGSTWAELPTCNLAYNTTLAVWTKLQASLLTSVGKTVRLRLQVQSIYGSAPLAGFAIDAFGVGEETPGVPILVAPSHSESVATVTPMLVISNAFDFQTDPLSYSFEVYDDLALSNMVAVVPVLASGTDTTSWQIDPPLANDAQYWWRCQASDGVNTGSWMPIATFFANQINVAPYRVRLVGPPPASILHDASHELSWRPSSDPDPGDVIASYQLEVDVSSSFTNPIISDPSIVVSQSPTGGDWVVSLPLSSFSGWGGLEDNTSYFWRMRARDQWDAWSAWSTNTIWFIYGTPPPTIMSMQTGAEQTLSFEWERSGTGVYIEYSPSLIATNWEIIAGPIYDTNTTLSVAPGQESGFYRVRTE